jgi:LysM repeat protein
VAQVVEQPAVYSLHRGEFPWCLARRFDIHPQDLMRANGFYTWQVYQPGQAVILPANAREFPGNRALRPSPATYIVQYGDTIFGIACYYGNVEPKAILAANGLQKGNQIYPGLQLQIPAAGSVPAQAKDGGQVGAVQPVTATPAAPMRVAVPGGRALSQ